MTINIFYAFGLELFATKQELAIPGAQASGKAPK